MVYIHKNEYCFAGIQDAWLPDYSQAWAKAGFLVVSIPTTDTTVFTESLSSAVPYGLFVLATEQPHSNNMTSTQVLKLADMYSCHTNFAGVVLGDQTTSVSNIAETATALRSVA
jgi:hypothetical protein